MSARGRRWLTGVPLALALLYAAVALAATWRIDPAESRLGFSGTQGGTPFDGKFGQFAADITFDPKDLASSRAVVTIEMASASTGNAQRDAAVQGPDWFAVADHPQARFETTAFRHIGGDAYEAQATLRIRDVTRPVALPFALQPEPNGTRARGELVINRLDYGIGQGQWASGAVVGHDVVIRFDLLAAPSS